jgi:putative hemolysin
VTVSGADLAMIILIGVLLLVAALLTVAETALTRMSRARAASLHEDGSKAAGALSALAHHPERWLNPLLLMALSAQLVQATLTGVVAERLFGALGVAVATFVNVMIVFVIAVAAPRTWAIQHTERAALATARPVGAIAAFPPLRLLSRALIGLTNVILPGKGLKQGPFVSEEELLALADAAVEEDVLHEDERKLIGQIIEFGDTVVREVMVPRPDMVIIPHDLRVADAMEVVLLNGLSRLPVMRGGADDIVGIVYAKDLMRAERDDQEDRPVGTLVRPARFVPETKRVAELLPEMQSEQFHMAMVADEYGGTAGLVTLEDLIEELVGEIVDEFDREEPMMEPMADGSVRVNARMPIDEVNDLIHAQLPEGDWDTIGGLVFHLLGHIPIEGEVVVVEGHELRAERVQGRRIGRVRIQAVEAAEVDGDEAAAPGADAPADAGADA